MEQTDVSEGKIILAQSGGQMRRKLCRGCTTIGNRCIRVWYVYTRAVEQITHFFEQINSMNQTVS